MGIKQINKGIRKFQEFHFTWSIPNYDFSKRYTNKVEIGKNAIKILMEPKYENGEIKGIDPFIMFDTVEGTSKRAKQFRYYVRTNVNDKSQNLYTCTVNFKPLRLNERYGSTLPFLRARTYKRFLSLDGTLSLCFDIFIMDIGYEVQAPVNNEKYSLDLQNFYNNKAFCDCEFIVDGNTIGANKIILMAQSKNLAEVMEKSGNKLPIDDCTLEIFKEFLGFVYCGKLINKNDNVLFGVLSLGHQYGIDDLKRYCENVLYNNLRSSNANAIFQAAHKYQLCDGLKKAAFFIIQKIFKEINQKLADEFINDPDYVDNLIKIAETLKNGLKRKEIIKLDEASIVPTQSAKQLTIETAIDNICKETEESLKDIEISCEEIEEEAGAAGAENNNVEGACALDIVDGMKCSLNIAVFNGKPPDTDAALFDHLMLEDDYDNSDTEVVIDYDEYDDFAILDEEIIQEEAKEVLNKTWERKSESFPLSFEVILEESEEEYSDTEASNNQAAKDCVNVGASTSENAVLLPIQSTSEIQQMQNLTETIQNYVLDISKQVEDFNIVDINKVIETEKGGDEKLPEIIIEDENMPEIDTAADIKVDEVKEETHELPITEQTEKVIKIELDAEQTANVPIKNNDEQNIMSVDEDFDFKKEVLIPDAAEHKQI